MSMLVALVRLAFGFAIVLPVAAAGAAAQEWELVQQFTRVDGFISDRKPDTAAYENWEIYDEDTAKYYSIYPLMLETDRTLIVDAYSYDFQPIIILQDIGYEVIHRGNIMPAQYQQSANANLYHARMEFTMDEAVPAELLITSSEPDQGSYAMHWALWKFRSANATPSPGTGAGTDFDCDCTDPATGRRFDEPIWGLGNCDPSTAVKWCN